MNKKFALIDCNSFYCSCERIFRPDLNKKPVIVLSNNDGCAIARSSEAKALGIEMGAPYFKIKHLCQKKEVAVFSSNFSFYSDISQRVMQTIQSWCPKVETYSIDEAFCDFSQIDNVQEQSKMLKNDIYQKTAIPVSIGIAPTKVLAKLANRIAKKSIKAQGIVYLQSEKLQDIALKQSKIEDVWGIGLRSSQKLKLLGIKTAYDFKIYKNEKVIQKVLGKIGLQIKHELMGISCLSLSIDLEAKKEIISSRSLKEGTYEKEDIKIALADHIFNATTKMRQQKSVCSELSIFARTNYFSNTPQFSFYKSQNLINPSDDTRKFIKLAYQMLDKVYQSEFCYKKIGIKLSNLSSLSEYQMNFLSQIDTKEDSKLMKTIDDINQTQGKNKIKLATCSQEKKQKQDSSVIKSPRYTLSWEELPLFY